MWLKFKVSIAGTRFQHKPGDVVNWPDSAEGKAEAQRFIAAGYAEETDAPRSLEPAKEKTTGKGGSEKADAKKPAEKTTGKGGSEKADKD